METITTREEIRAAVAKARKEGKTVGLVPTMGFLHTGHESLILRASSECDFVVTTIFVNPLQFGPDEDLDSYPRDIEGDTALAAAAGTAALFTPTTEEMYPEEMFTAVEVKGLSEAMEGASRRTHFGGVATVVTKIFSLIGECSAYFGEKDYQQLAIVTRMSTDLSLPVRVVGCPTVREPDGLALSSRNKYLTRDERKAAPVLQRALRHGAELVQQGETSSAVVKDAMSDLINAEPLGELDYVEIADRRTLEITETCGQSSRLFGAVRFGRARLIDNVGIGTARRGGT